MDKIYLTIEEAADYMNVTIQTIRNYIYKGTLKSEKQYFRGMSFRHIIRKEDIDELIDKQMGL